MIYHHMFSRGTKMADNTITNATHKMAAVGISFDTITDYAQKAVELLQNKGDEAIELVKLGFKAYIALSNKDYIGFLSVLNDANKNIQDIIAAIKETFNI